MTKETLEQRVIQAQAGNRGALEAVIRHVQDDVHHLAMRMLVNPEDALDAVQEILILVTTRLSTFAGKSAFKTWVFRIAINFLTTKRKILARDPALSFADFQQDLESGLAPGREAIQEDDLMLNELRVSCTMAMLLCLDHKHRVAYVLGYILEMPSEQAAEVLAITKANFRKRLSRARVRVEAFTSRACGLANADAKCSCPRRLPAAIAAGRVRPGQVAFALTGTPGYGETAAVVRKLENDLKTLALQKAVSNYPSPRDFGAMVEQLVAD